MDTGVLDEVIRDVEKPYLPPVHGTGIEAFPGGWWFVAGMAVVLAGVWLFYFLRHRVRRARRKARDTVGLLRRLEEPLTRDEKHLLHQSLRRLPPTRHGSALRDPDEVRRLMARRSLGTDSVRVRIGMKLATAAPERSESLRSGTRLRLRVGGFPGHFEAVVRYTAPDGLRLDLIDPGLRRVAFEAGDRVEAVLFGVRPRFGFATVVLDCVSETAGPGCRIAHGDIVPMGRAE